MFDQKCRRVFPQKQLFKAKYVKKKKKISICNSFVQEGKQNIV